jgi:hypothetical protein
MQINIPKLTMLLEMNEEELFQYLLKIFQVYQEKNKKIILDPLEEHYIYIEGDYPVMVVAHLDTFLNAEYGENIENYDYFELEQLNQGPVRLKKDIKPIYTDLQEGVVWSPVGLGADDRAGVYLILELISNGVWPHILFTTDEECGARGAFLFSILMEKYIQNSDIKYFLQLDRRGSSDCVFYDCKNIKFKEYIKSFCWIETEGLFSDISILSPELNIAGVNISVGYENEHTLEETLSLFTLAKNYDKIYSMIKNSKAIDRFNYSVKGDMHDFR